MSATDVGTSDTSIFPREEHPRARHRSTAPRRHQVWGAVGFVLGIVVWHFVGFWSLVSTILYRGPEPTVLSAEDQRERAALMAARQAWAKPDAPPARITTGSIGKSALACAALVIDRTAQSTSLADCTPDPSAQQAAAHSQPTSAALRADRLAIAATNNEAADHSHLDEKAADLDSWSIAIDTSRLERPITLAD